MFDTCSRCGSITHYICPGTLDEEEAQVEAQVSTLKDQLNLLHNTLHKSCNEQLASLQAQLAELEKRLSDKAGIILGLLALIRHTQNIPFYQQITEEQIRKVMEG